jgi:UDP-N-acetylmuramate dehydrogenase
MTAADPLRAIFGDRLKANMPLTPLTTFKVGGPAEWFIELRDGDEVRRLIDVSRAAGIPVTILGGGSNVLVADAGVKGVVARVRGGDVRLVGPETVRADAGVTINGLVRWTITHGLAGLEAWAGTPGTVGGAIFGNAHFQGRTIGEIVRAVVLVTPDAAVVEVPAERMAFAYDYSRLHRTREVVLSADFAVTAGEPEALRAVARASLAFRKRTQPLALASAGCVFQNPDPVRDGLPPGLPASAGALVDRAGLKGASEGGARVSPTHANFIVNEGHATAADVRRLVERCKTAVRQRFGVELKEEIVYLGFDEGSHVHAAD